MITIIMKQLMIIVLVVIILIIVIIKIGIIVIVILILLIIMIIIVIVILAGPWSPSSCATLAPQRPASLRCSSASFRAAARALEEYYDIICMIIMLLV